MSSNIPTLGLYIDWNNDGDFFAAGSDVTERLLTRTTIAVAYGRDQSRELSPPKPGSSSFELNNSSRDYSPDYVSSPLHGRLAPGRPVLMTATQDAKTYTLYRGFIDDYSVRPEPENRSVQYSCLDILARFQKTKLSTELYGPGVRTGTAIGYILDQMQWPSDMRDIDVGASTIPWWWEEGTDGLAALKKVIAAEGMPAMVYLDVDGNFAFRDRHHRLTRAASLTSQVTFTSGSIPESDSVVMYSGPAEYDAGWRDIVNTINASVDQRSPEGELSTVWQAEDTTLTVPSGGNVTITAQANDPFTGAVVPEEDTDFQLLSGAVTVSLSRTSGVSTVITFTDTSGGSVVSAPSLRAYSVPNASTVQIDVQDASSVKNYGVCEPQGFDPGSACVEDVRAVASLMVGMYAERVPTASVTVHNASGSRLTQQLDRDLSDRVHITDTETGLDADCFIEQISHAISEGGMSFVTTFGFEKVLTQAANPFTFDTSGKGFNDGAFGASGIDNPTTVFIFDHAPQGKFDVGLFGT